MPASPNPFIDQLNTWGPGHARQPSLDESRQYCRRLATSHYENFPVVSRFVPRGLRQHFCNIYAYCRWADDLGDEVDSSEQALELLAWWRGELAACYAGEVRHPVFVALADTIQEFAIPPQPFEDLVSAFEQDQSVRNYATFAELRDYCRRSADPVGRLVLSLYRQATDQNFAWSDSICTGLQLANFWQDVARDSDIGRVYLPREDRLRFGYTDENLSARQTTPAFLELMEFEVQRARELLNAWRQIPATGPTALPWRLQLATELFAAGGLAILDRIAAIGYRVWETRPKLHKRDMIWLSAKVCGRSIQRRWWPGRT